ncbi:MULTISPECIES: hypothetical protein [unclassified Lysinibacillus]|jgi:hypothetical protein|uniref:hypothetical protein n=2 Tax=Lysinibacillus TaxID=400634 RepID=UPI00382C3671
MSLEQMLGFLGIVLGISGGLFGLWWGRRMAARKNGLDERYEKITVSSLANGWKITVISIYVLFLLLIAGVQLSTAQALGILLLIHMAGWAFSTVYYNLKY